MKFWLRSAQEPTPRALYSPGLGLWDERSQAAEKVDDASLVQDLRDHSRGDHPRVDLAEMLGHLQLRIHQALLQRQNHPRPGRLQREHPSLDRSSDLEPLLRVLQLDVGVVVWPDDSVDGPSNVDEEALVSELVDRSLPSAP